MGEGGQITRRKSVFSFPSPEWGIFSWGCQGMTSQYMNHALLLARRGQGVTSPNPMVGAVVVDTSGKIIAEGFHKRAGTPHAETAALRKAGSLAKGQTLYVTLEPCNHAGRTPRCTDAIIAAGIKQVVVAVRDPNPYVAGGGIEHLSKAGVAVTVGDGAQEAQRLNRNFFTWARAHRPWITLKAAMSLDGKVAAFTGESKYLTSPKALAHAHELRRQHDAILVGSGTILQDNPRLTYRGSRKGANPVRVILDSRGRTPFNAEVFRTGSDSPTLIFTGHDTPRAWERQMFSAGGEVIRVANNSSGHINLLEVLGHLADRRILSVLVEGGPTIHAAFVEGQLADRWVGYVAPLLLGGDQAPSAVGGRGLALPEAALLHIERVLRRGPDVVIDALFVQPTSEYAPADPIPAVKEVN